MIERLKAIGRRRVIREGAWVLVGQVATAAVMLVTTRLTTELVKDTSVLGTTSLFLGSVLLVKNVFCSPILQAQQRFYPEFAASGQIAKLRGISWRVLTPVTSAVVAVALLVGGIHAWQSEQISWWIYVALAGLVAQEAFRSMETNFLQAARRQKALTAVNTAEAIARPMTMVLAVWLFGPSPAVILFGYLTGSAAVYFATLATLPREGLSPAEPTPVATAPDVPPPRVPAVAEVIRYAIPLAPLAILGSITAISDRYIIGARLGTADVGVYSTTYSLMSQPFMLAMSVTFRTLMPIYYKAVSDGESDLERRTFRAWVWSTLAVCGAGFVAVLLLDDLIAMLLLSAPYRPGVRFMPWIAAGHVLYALGCVYETRLYAHKRTGLVLLGNAAVAFASIAAPLLLMPRWGVLGVAIACPVYFGVHVLVMMFLAARSERQDRARSAASPDPSHAPAG